MPLPLILAPLLGLGMAAGTAAVGGHMQRREQERQTAAFEQAKRSPGLTTPGRQGQPAQQEQAQPAEQLTPQAAFQSTLLGQPIFLPGPPMQPPVMKRNYNPQSFTRRTIDVPDHLGGGTLTVEPNEGGFFEASQEAHLAHYQAQGLKGTQAERKALVGAEFATAREFGRQVRLDQVRQLMQGSPEEQYALALVEAGELLTQGRPWSEIPGLLISRDLYIPAENLDRIRDFYMNKYLSKAAMETNDPRELDQLRRDIQNYFNVPKERPVARVKDITGEARNALLAQGLTLEDPIPGTGRHPTTEGGGTASVSAVDAAKERIRFWDRPRVQQEKIDSWGKALAYKDAVNSVYDIIENPEAGRHLTGPADWVRRSLENLGIWVNTDRVALRSKAAQLWEILYAVRGKQLSDFEIKLAKDMFAALNQPMEMFEARLDEFSRYTHRAVINSIRAEVMAGRDVGDFSKYVDTDTQVQEQYGPRGLDRDGRGYYYVNEQGQKVRIQHPNLL